jgi:hypothetical protein
MSQTGNITSSTKVLEMSTASCISCPVSVAHSPLIPSTHAQIFSSFIDRSCPSKGCKPRTNSSASIASCTSRFVFYRQRWICRSSNVRLWLMSCLDLELEVRNRAKKSC